VPETGADPGTESASGSLLGAFRDDTYRPEAGYLATAADERCRDAANIDFPYDKSDLLRCVSLTRRRPRPAGDPSPERCFDVSHSAH